MSYIKTNIIHFEPLPHGWYNRYLMVDPTGCSPSGYIDHSPCVGYVTFEKYIVDRGTKVIIGLDERPAEMNYEDGEIDIVDNFGPHCEYINTIQLTNQEFEELLEAQEDHQFTIWSPSSDTKREDGPRFYVSAEPEVKEVPLARIWEDEDGHEGDDEPTLEPVEGSNTWA